MNQFEVGPFIEATYVVRFANAPFVEDGVNGTGVVLDPEPISDVVAFAINRQWFFVDDVVDH